jgi:hypothetical protein
MKSQFQIYKNNLPLIYAEALFKGKRAEFQNDDFKFVK